MDRTGPGLFGSVFGPDFGQIRSSVRSVWTGTGPWTGPRVIDRLIGFSVLLEFYPKAKVPNRRTPLGPRLLPDPRAVAHPTPLSILHAQSLTGHRSFRRPVRRFLEWRPVRLFHGQSRSVTLRPSRFAGIAGFSLFLSLSSDSASQAADSGCLRYSTSRRSPVTDSSPPTPFLSQSSTQVLSLFLCLPV